jgi:hypothetical protein
MRRMARRSCSRPKLTEDAEPDSWSYRKADVDLSKYKAFLIEPTLVHSDPTASWGGTTPQERAAFAEMLTQDLRNEIGQSYPLASKPGPGVATMRLTLLGVSTTQPAAAVASRVTTIGIAMNGVKSLRGKPGSFTGSAHLAFELTDSRSGELLAAAVRRRSPNALNISAALSTEKTVAAISKDVAKSIREGLDAVQGR